MRDGFCHWCVKYAKYLTFGTFERADESAFNDKYKLITYHLIVLHVSFA